MRCVDASIRVASRFRLDGCELKLAAFIRRDSRESSGKRLIPRSGVAHLPYFENRVRHRLSVTIQNSPANGRTRSVCPGTFDIRFTQGGQPDREKRSHRLRSRRQGAHFIVPSGLLPARAKQCQSGIPTQIRAKYFPSRMSKSAAASPFHLKYSYRSDRSRAADHLENTSG